MAGFNRVILIGNLTRDPEYKQLTSGQAVCRLGIATNRNFKNRQSGTVIQEVCYIDIDVWGAQADSCRQYLSKGRPVLVEGRIKYDSWKEDATGQTRSKHSIVADRVVFLGSASEAEATSEQASTDTSSWDAPDFAPREPQNEVEKELMDQLEKLKNRTKPATASKTTAARAKKEEAKAPAVDDIDFQDQAPFQDDLPF